MLRSKFYTSCLVCMLFFIAFFALPLKVSAKDPAEAAKAKLVTKFPFTLTSKNIILIKAQFGNFRDTLNFILDTGSGGISLDSATAKNYNLSTTTTEATIRGISNLKPAEFIVNQQLRLPGLVVQHLNFHINDYSFLSEACEKQVNGVIGYSLLKSYIVKINYDNRTIEIWSPGRIGYPKDGLLVNSNINQLATLDATVADQRKINGRFYFDTGADICFLLPSTFIKDSNVISTDKKMVLSQAEGLGGKKEMQVTTVDHVNIGPYVLKNVPTYIFDDTYNISNYPATGGIVGNELMVRFNVILNYPEGKIHLSPNSFFNKPFNYSYVGCTILMEDGKAVIKDILKDSPAHKAGLKNDDVIYGINNNFRNDVNEYKRLFSTAGAKLKVFLLRDNQVTSTILQVESIL